ncbi:MAG TPA: hypothetical protein VK797_08535 [Tepidisphaeraceae bacterium]|jgi:hypothetical protein|nr:hypothetical protein [Tepidisphaeraceae bacterium]
MPRIAQFMLMTLAFVGVVAGDQRASVAPVVAASAPEPVIVRLASRGQTITILAGHGRSLYSVTDPAGRTIVSRASLEELRAGYPEIYRQVAPGVALYAGLGD